jgi:hypothetical protein
VDTQMGGRKNYSAVDALINISTPMGRSLRRDKYPNPKSNQNRTIPSPSLLTHDIDSAFNNTDPEVLIQIMEQRRLPSYMTLWVKAFTTDRKLAFGFDGKSEDQKPFTRDLPQGSPISPFFSLSQPVQFLRTWSVIFRLLRNKTNSMLYMSMITLPSDSSQIQSSHFRLLPLELVPSRQFRKLGVIFDESLNFIPHARDTAAEGIKALGKTCFLRHR